jgi:hypothetical protein
LISIHEDDHDDEENEEGKNGESWPVDVEHDGAGVLHRYATVIMSLDGLGCKNSRQLGVKCQWGLLSRGPNPDGKYESGEMHIKTMFSILFIHLCIMIVDRVGLIPFKIKEYAYSSKKCYKYKEGVASISMTPGTGLPVPGVRVTPVVLVR